MLLTKTELLEIFSLAIENELAIDKNYIERTKYEVKNYGFTPIRPAKSLKYIKKYKLSINIYRLAATLFLLTSPLYFLAKLLAELKIPKYQLKNNQHKRLILLANSRTEYLVKKNNLIGKSFLININQKNNEFHSIHYFLNFTDYIRAYFNAILSILYLTYKLEDKKDILQCYVAYEWFLTYQALTKINNIEDVVYSNHYDRWAVLFDSVFCEKNTILLQHGILPESLELPYKPKNIKTVLVFNTESQKIFKSLFLCGNIKFLKQNIKLNVQDICKKKPTILIIGQPHSMEREIELGKSLAYKYQLYVKPHPLYEYKKYKEINAFMLIKDKDFYPKTDIVLCYESTLGLEYEASGVKVIWWKGINNKIILELIDSLLNNIEI